MARIRWDGTELVVELTRREKVAALRGDVRVPRGAVRSAALLDDGLAAVRGLRAPGLHVPRRTKIGTWRGRGGRVFAVVRRGEPAVRVALADGQRYRELVVGGPDAAAAAAALR